MSQLGFSVMINLLSNAGSQTPKVISKAINKRITEARLSDSDNGGDGMLHFAFEDGYRMGLKDNGRSCCEHRYMTTDDKLEDFVGALLMGVELRDAPDKEDEYGDVHEVQFLLINTTRGTFTVETHNEHNGYYGGFSIEAVEE